LLRLPDLVTILNILFGFTAILFVLNGYVYGAIILILVAALADGVDGAVARRFESGVFGEHLDSFADLISFGVAPAVIYYAIASDYCQVRYNRSPCVSRSSDHGGRHIRCALAVSRGFAVSGDRWNRHICHAIGADDQQRTVSEGPVREGTDAARCGIHLHNRGTLCRI